MNFELWRTKQINSVIQDIFYLDNFKKYGEKILTFFLISRFIFWLIKFLHHLCHFLMKS